MNDNFLHVATLAMFVSLVGAAFSSSPYPWASDRRAGTSGTPQSQGMGTHKDDSSNFNSRGPNTTLAEPRRVVVPKS